MLRHQNIPLLRHRHMRIDFRNINRTMPQHFLNIPDVHIRLQQTCGKSMPEHMRRDMLLDGGESGILIDHPADGLV